MYRTLGSSAAATCAAHPSFPSVDVCTRCQAHTCAHCNAYEALAPLCASCARLAWTQRARSRSRTTRVVGALVAVVALVTIGVAARWRIDPHGWGTHRHTIEALATMLHEHPCSPEKVRWITWELDAAHDRASAARYLDEVVAVCKLPSDVHKLAFDMHMATGQPESAVRDASRRVILDGKDVGAYLDRSRAYVRLGKPYYAVLDALAAQQLGGDDPQLVESIMRLYRLSGDPQPSR